MAEPKWTGLKVRQTFFEYFEKRGHTIGMSFLERSTMLSV
jgi:alanyl-tRNA synthetase